MAVVRVDSDCELGNVTAAVVRSIPSSLPLLPPRRGICGQFLFLEVAMHRSSGARFLLSDRLRKQGNIAGLFLLTLVAFFLVSQTLLHNLLESN
jgi:hypothetical protein